MSFPGLEPQVRCDDNEGMIEQRRLRPEKAQGKYRRIFTQPTVFTTRGRSVPVSPPVGAAVTGDPCSNLPSLECRGELMKDGVKVETFHSAPQLGPRPTHGFCNYN